MGLRTRLALAGVALQVPADYREVARLSPVIDAGVDLVILDGSDDVEADVEFLRDVRQHWAGRPLLVGTSSTKVAAPAAADVVHLRSPGWRFWGSPRGHQWSLLGRHAALSGVVESPGEDFDYLIVATSGPQDHLLAAALTHQPPLTTTAIPWFAQLGAAQGITDAAGIDDLLSAGVRRLALPEDLLDGDDAPEHVAAVAEAVKKAWASDDRASNYRFGAFRLPNQ